MEKERLIAKLSIKDYNKELENILQTKHFSKLCNNLLLSMLYKIESSYEDYKKVKFNAPSKKEYMEELLKIIKDDCKEISIVKLNDKEAQELKNKKSKIVKNKKEIITYENELVLLKSLFELYNNEFKINSADEIRKIAISQMLNKGEKCFKCEVVRDFDGWSWNTNLNDIEDYNSRLYYQLLVNLLGYEFLNNNKNISVKVLEDVLKEKYKPAIAENLFKLINQIAISEYIWNNKDEESFLKQTCENLNSQMKMMGNKKMYIEKITEEKKKKIKEIEEIDKYINDDLKLKKEYIKQNQNLSQEKRFFSLSDFSEKVQQDRIILQQEITELTEKLKPRNFVKEKTNIEKNLEYINEINLENKNSSNLINEFILVCLKAFEEQIKQITTKKEAIEKLYELRYISLFNINSKNIIGKVYKKQIERVQKNLTTIACNLKALEIFSKDVEENFRIYKNIFETRIIDLESVYIEINKENVVKIYDENSIEKEEQSKEFKDLTIKRNKKIKMFI